MLQLGSNRTNAIGQRALVTTTLLLLQSERQCHRCNSWRGISARGASRRRGIWQATYIADAPYSLTCTAAMSTARHLGVAISWAVASFASKGLSLYFLVISILKREYDLMETWTICHSSLAMLILSETFLCCLIWWTSPEAYSNAIVEDISKIFD